MYYVYMLRCKDGSLYTGYTTDINRRVQEHQAGKGCKYTCSRCPVKLVYAEKIDSKTLALRREREIKSLTKMQKEELVKSREQSYLPTI